MNTNFNTLLINDELLRLYSPLRADALTEEMTPYVLVAQEQHIKPILGIALYEDLQETICHDTLTPEYSALVVKIAPALAQLTCFTAAPFMWTTWNTKGITRMNSENSDPIDVKDVAQLRTWLLDQANAFLVELKRFLEDNKDSYPLYYSEDCCEDRDITAHTQISFSVPKKPIRL